MKEVVGDGSGCVGLCVKGHLLAGQSSLWELVGSGRSRLSRTGKAPDVEAPESKKAQFIRKS